MLINNNFNFLNNYYGVKNKNLEKVSSQKENTQTSNNSKRLEAMVIYDPKNKDQLSPKEWGEIYNREVEASKPKAQSIDRAEVDRIANEYVQKWLDDDSQYGSVGYAVYDNNGNKVKKTWNESMATLIAEERYVLPATEKNLNNYLKENGVHLDENDKFEIFIDEHLNVTISGLHDKDKTKQIEDLLNDTDEFWGYKLNKLKKKYSSDYLSMDSEDRRLINQKNTEESNLRYYSGGTVTLSDLSLENGKIIGLPHELDELYNVTKADLTEEEKIGWEATNKMIKKLLTIGIENIPDLTAKVTYDGGKLSIEDYVDPFVV